MWRCQVQRAYHPESKAPLPLGALRYCLQLRHSSLPAPVSLQTSNSTWCAMGSSRTARERYERARPAMASTWEIAAACAGGMAALECDSERHPREVTLRGGFAAQLVAPSSVIQGDT